MISEPSQFTYSSQNREVGKQWGQDSYVSFPEMPLVVEMGELRWPGPQADTEEGGVADPDRCSQTATRAGQGNRRLFCLFSLVFSFLWTLLG